MRKLPIIAESVFPRPKLLVQLVRSPIVARLTCNSPLIPGDRPSKPGDTRSLVKNSIDAARVSPNHRVQRPGNLPTRVTRPGVSPSRGRAEERGNAEGDKLSEAADR